MSKDNMMLAILHLREVYKLVKIDDSELCDPLSKIMEYILDKYQITDTELADRLEWMNKVIV